MPAPMPAGADDTAALPARVPTFEKGEQGRGRQTVHQPASLESHGR